jgi:5-methylcytosine-specific restriction endonuclease McrA
MRKQNGQFGKGDHWREPQAFREKEWLVANYINAQRSTGEIAAEFGTTDAAILFWLRRHEIPRRTVAQARAIKHWGQEGEDNPMWNKRGELNPRWLGGVTPERQDFYTSRAWKDACRTVWGRDKGICQRCGIKHKEALDIPFHIHHIVSFADKDLRAEPGNLVLLCEVCHWFVHSRRNLNGEFLPTKRDTSAPP